MLALGLANAIFRQGIDRDGAQTLLAELNEVLGQLPYENPLEDTLDIIDSSDLDHASLTSLREIAASPHPENELAARILDALTHLHVPSPFCPHRSHNRLTDTDKHKRHSPVASTRTDPHADGITNLTHDAGTEDN